MTRKLTTTLFALALFVACAAPRHAEGERSFRLVSYNVKHGLGMDGRLDLERTARVLERLEPDVVVLQEMDENCARSGDVDQAAWLGERLGMHHAFAPFMEYDGGRYGLATLSRFPVAVTDVVVLPPGKREPRSALVLELDVDGVRVRVANAHLDWLSDDTERVAQASELSAALGLDGSDTVPLVLAGDLNDVPESRTLAILTGEGAMRWLGPSGSTFPSDGSQRTIDHVLVAPAKGAWRASEVRVVDEPVASDHAPLVVDLEVL